MGKYTFEVAWVSKYSYNIQYFIIQLTIELRFVMEADTTVCDRDEAQMGFFINDRKLRDAHAPPPQCPSLIFHFHSSLFCHLIVVQPLQPPHLPSQHLCGRYKAKSTQLKLNSVGPHRLHCSTLITHLHRNIGNHTHTLSKPVDGEWKKCNKYKQEVIWGGGGDAHVTDR